VLDTNFFEYLLLVNGLVSKINFIYIFLISEKKIDDTSLTKLPCEEGKIVFNNEPDPEKYVS